MRIYDFRSDFDDATTLIQLRWPEGLPCPCGSIRDRRIQTRPRVLFCAR